MSLNSSKPRALAIASPYEPRIAYFLAGLSHFYQLDVCYIPNGKRYTKKNQIFYLWHYAKDAKFFPFLGPRELLNSMDKYEAVFFHSEAFNLYNTDIYFFKNKEELKDYLKNLKSKTSKLYFMECAEFYFFNYTDEGFWKIVDGVIKHHVFKKEYSYLLRQSMEILDYHVITPRNNKNLPDIHKNFEVEKYCNKIFPLPMPPGIVDPPVKIKPLTERPYDLAGNFWRNSGIRASVMEEAEDYLKNRKYTYSFDYGDAYRTNCRYTGNFLNPLLTSKWQVGKVLSKIFYGKYRFPKMLYMDNIKNSRCNFGLGLIGPSLRDYDCWSYGSVLVTWGYDKMEYGIPMLDGYNYVSLGQREEISPDNINFAAGQREKVLSKIELILSDRKKQEEVVKNQLEIFWEYFSSPKNFVKKIFINKAMPELAGE